MVDNIRKKEAKAYAISTSLQLKGFVKNGLDSSVLINIITAFDAEFKGFREKGFTFPPNLFCYHEISYPETIGVLINRHKFTEKEAKDSFGKLVDQFNLQKLQRVESVDGAFENIVQEANKKVVAQEKNPCLRIGIQDTIIIGGFLRSKVNIIHSGDMGFLKTCEELKINTIPLPKRDIERERKIREWMKNRRS